MSAGNWRGRRWLRRSKPDFDALARTWDALGQDDPLWAVLQFPGKRGGRWEPEAFFRHGEHEIDRILGVVRERGWPLKYGAALDFGCGAGRLTQALCRHFERVDGVDIAPSMIEAARRFNRYPERCRYHLNQAQDLALFPDASFDFIYSILVLQHMHPRFARRYVGEFVRTLGPGGLALFELTTAKSKMNPTLARSAFAADQRLLSDMPRMSEVGATFQVEISVKNTSSLPWPAHGDRAVRVGARWRKGGRDWEAASARENLSDNLRPWQSETVSLIVRSPERPGHYVLEVGLLQEEVAWFADRGVPAMRAEVHVLPASVTAGTGGALPASGVEMHVTPVAEVLRWVREADGRVIDVLDADQPEAGFRGSLFTVTGRS